MDLDHLFICCAVGAPEADRLLDIGLVEGSPNQHPGQGTANRRFFFQNAFLELLWVADPAEAQSESTRRTCLWDRWLRRGHGASPFGIGIRTATQEVAEVPFPAWEYRPAYLPDPMVIQMGTNSKVLAEPLLFSINFGRRLDSFQPPRLQPLSHAVSWKSITRVSIVSPHGGEASPALCAVEKGCPWFGYRSGSEHLLEVGFDEERAGEFADLRPVLPLIFRW